MDPAPPDPRTLAADLFQQFEQPVMARLRRRYPMADPELRWDAFTHAVLHLASHFERYDPGRGSLRAFLAWIAERRLQTLLRADHRRRAREQEKAARTVSVAESAANNLLEGLAQRELLEEAKKAIAQSPEERQALELYLRGAALSEYFGPLGLTGLPEGEARAYVDRLLARLRKRAQRYCRRRRTEEGLS
jgi:DNA-directed RNA polymerase specialized sigma24 family protein